jgi:hypothetical protein
MYVNDNEAFLRSLQTLTTQFKESQAQYSQEILLKASELEALARKTTILSAEVQDSRAAITEEQFVRATADEAIAQQITTIEAEVADNAAAIVTESTARANADSALASQITTLTSTVGSKNRTYYQSTAPTSGMVSGDLWIDSDDDKLYRYNGSSWVNIQDNQIGQNTAAISSEATTRATADSVNATAINAVTARLDTGDFAAVKTESSATASKVSGIEARWGVTTNVNGYVAGIQLLNGGSTQSSFTIAADKFIVRRPNNTVAISWNGTTSRLEIAGAVYADAFFGNVIGTTNVNSNAITGSASTSAGSGNISLNFTSTGGPVYVFAQALLDSSPIGCTLFVNGSAVREDFVVAGGDRKTPAFIYLWQPAAGTYNYSLIGSSSTLTTPNLMVLEAKR